MRAPYPLLLALVIGLQATSAVGGDARLGCTLEYGGALGGSHECRSPTGAVLTNGAYLFTVMSRSTPGAPSLSFQIALKADTGAGTYTLADLPWASLVITQAGKPALAWMGGVSAKAKPSGSLTLTLTSGGRKPHGTLTAVLPCGGVACTGEAKVDAKF